MHLDENDPEQEFYGILDGGHTNAIVNVFRRELQENEGDDSDGDERIKETHVNVQVLIPPSNGGGELSSEMVDLLNDIKRVRNTSVPVKKRDLENAKHHFDVIKEALKDAPYADQIRWREEKDGGKIDGQTIIILLMVFCPEFCTHDDDPTQAYGKKYSCLDAFLDSVEKDPDHLKRWIRFLPELLKLHDEIEKSFPEFYNAAGGKFGKYKNVQSGETKEGQPKYQTLLKSPTHWKFPLA